MPNQLPIASAGSGRRARTDHQIRRIVRYVSLAVAWLWALAGYSQATATQTGRAGSGKQVTFEHYGQEKGLSQGTGYDIVQFDGFMWFATQDGLNRFDGYEFRVFRPGKRSGLASSVVQTLLVDKRGQFWVGTGGGLNRYDKATERFAPFSATAGVSHRLDSVAIERLLEDKAGNLWVMTDEKGLYCVNTTSSKIESFFTDDHSLYGMSLDAGGNVWLSTYHAIYRYDPASRQFRVVINQQQLASQSLLGSILFDKRGNLWVGTRSDGVFVVPLGDGRYRPDHRQNYQRGSEIRALLGDRLGRVWVGTRADGLSIYEPTSQTVLQLNHSRNNIRSLAENNIWSLYEDPHGIVWVGFNSHGVDKYDPNRFTFHLIQRDLDQSAYSLPDNMIFKLFGQGNALFIGTETGGLVEYSRTTGRVTHLLGSSQTATRPPAGGLRPVWRVMKSG